MCLVLPEVCTAAMSVFLTHFARALPADQHAVLVLDQAGWHGAKALQGPDTITLVPLPAYSPELNPVERVGCTCGSTFSPTACWRATTRLSLPAAKPSTPERLRSRTNQPWIQKVTS